MRLNGGSDLTHRRHEGIIDVEIFSENLLGVRSYTARKTQRLGFTAVLIRELIVISPTKRLIYLQKTRALRRKNYALEPRLLPYDIFYKFAKRQELISCKVAAALVRI